MLKLPRRKFLHLAAGAAMLPTISQTTRAQTYPSKPVRWIVGFAAGGTTDILARLMGQWLSERIGQQFIIENRPGANANIAVDVVVRAAPDGYTLLQVGSVQAFNASLYDNLSFNFIRDIAPVGTITRFANVIVVNPNVPAKTVAELIAFAKLNPGKLNMGSGGNGSMQHVAGELFKMMSGVNLQHVPYRGGAPALTDLIGGQVQVIVAPLPESIEYIKAGKVRALAVTTASRLPILPDLPTVAESLPGYEATGWQGVGTPKATPAEIIEKLNKEIVAGLADARMQARLTDLGGSALALSATEFGKLIAEDTDKWAKVIKFANIKAE